MSLPASSEEALSACAICLAAPVERTLTSCGHSCLCAACCEHVLAQMALPSCPICTVPIPSREAVAPAPPGCPSFLPSSLVPRQAKLASELQQGFVLLEELVKETDRLEAAAPARALWADGLQHLLSLLSTRLLLPSTAWDAPKLAALLRAAEVRDAHDRHQELLCCALASDAVALASRPDSSAAQLRARFCLPDDLRPADHTSLDAALARCQPWSCGGGGKGGSAPPEGLAALSLSSFQFFFNAVPEESFAILAHTCRAWAAAASAAAAAELSPAAPSLATTTFMASVYVSAVAADTRTHTSGLSGVRAAGKVWSERHARLCAARPEGEDKTALLNAALCKLGANTPLSAAELSFTHAVMRGTSMAERPPELPEPTDGSAASHRGGGDTSSRAAVRSAKAGAAAALAAAQGGDSAPEAFLSRFLSSFADHARCLTQAALLASLSPSGVSAASEESQTAFVLPIAAAVRAAAAKTADSADSALSALQPSATLRPLAWLRAHVSPSPPQALRVASAVAGRTLAAHSTASVSLSQQLLPHCAMLLPAVSILALQKPLQAGGGPSAAPLPPRVDDGEEGDPDYGAPHADVAEGADEGELLVVPSPAGMSGRVLRLAADFYAAVPGSGSSPQSGAHFAALQHEDIYHLLMAGLALGLEKVKEGATYSAALRIVGAREPEARAAVRAALHMPPGEPERSSYDAQGRFIFE